jgi:tryptophan synthase alpha chain
MPYFPVGYPSMAVSVDVIEALARGGADLIEVGVPFSDPLADGPVIQQATQVALAQGATVAGCLEAVTELRRRGVSVPLVLMGYYNPLLAFGLPRLAAAAAAAGASGFIVPDLPPEESADLSAALAGAPGDLPVIRMLAPTTPPNRVARIVAGARGFIYLVSVAGVTGARAEISAGLPALVARVREHTDLPLCVGFGISTPAQGRAVGAFADGIIVGSACVKTIGPAPEPVKAAYEFAKAFKAKADAA